MNRTARILGFVLAVSSPLAFGQTICNPRLGAGHDCYDYDQGTYIDMRPRLGIGYEPYRDIGEERLRDQRPNIYHGYGVAPPILRGSYDTYNYETDEFGIITPRLGGEFRIDTY